MRSILFAFALMMNSASVYGSVFTVQTSNVGFGPHEDPIPLTQKFIDHLHGFGTRCTLSRGSGIEPAIAVNPMLENQVVAFWVQNPYATLQDFGNIGGQDAGIAYTSDQGVTWGRTLVPFSISLGGVCPFVDNLWSDYSSDGQHLYLTGIGYDFGSDSKIFAVRSKNNGISWEKTQFLHTQLNQTYNYDKPSMTADRNHPNFAYIVCDDYDQNKNGNHTVSAISTTTDGGVTWSPFSLLYDPHPDLKATGLSNGLKDDNYVINNIVIVLPKIANSLIFKGELLNFMTRTYKAPRGKAILSDIAFVRSKDFGRTWETNATRVASNSDQDKLYPGGFQYDAQGSIIGGNGSPFFAVQQLFSVAVNPTNGYLYVAWVDANLTNPKTLQIALVTSRDGGQTWSGPVKINQTPSDAINAQAFLPAVAVTGDGRVGILYNDLRFDDRSNLDRTKTDVWLDVYREVVSPSGGSTGVGLDFVEEHRLSVQSFMTQNAPPFNGQHQNGDYAFLKAGAKNFYAAYFIDFEGPFAAAEILRNRGKGRTISLETNYRNAPFVSIIRQL